MKKVALPKLAALLVAAERALAAAARRRDLLRAELLGRMQEVVAEDPTARAIDVPGEGLVTYLDPSSAETIDARACAQKLAALGERLRELGANDVDDEIPMRTVERPACLRVSARF